MKLLVAYLLFFATLGSFSQNTTNKQWDNILHSAHNLGYCLYNVNQQFCNAHIIKHEQLAKEMSTNELEINCFIMKEEWAKQRVENWAERVSGWKNRTKLSVENLVLFFRISQDNIGEVPIATIETASAFFVVNLEDDLKFFVRKSYKNIALNCVISHKQKPNILWNILWREFTSGRQGLLKNEVEFTVFSNSKIRRNFRIFKRHFYKIKEEITLQP